MKVRVNSILLITSLVGAIQVAPTSLTVAQAQFSAGTNHVLTVGTGTIKVFATTTQTFVSPGVTLSTSVSNGSAKNFYINNGGSLSITRFTLTITLPNNSNISAFRRCNLNVSFSGTNICSSGSSTTISTPVSGSATTYTLILPANSYYSFQIVQNKTGNMTIDSLANSSNIVAGVINS